jgi:hypothetical protein
MTLLGWLFMIGSALFVWGLTLWCYVKVLTAPREPAEPVKDFRSA